MYSTNGSCTDVCAGGFYTDLVNSMCRPCNVGCTTCSDNSACGSCNMGYSLNSSSGDCYCDFTAGNYIDGTVCTPIC